MHSIATLDLRHFFQLAELTEIMHQKDFKQFTDVLNKIRVGNADQTVENLLCSRFVSLNSQHYPTSD